jgi:exocyst complex component 1
MPLQDFVESTESLLQTLSPAEYSSISVRQSHRPAVLKKILSAYDAKELRHGIQTLKKRVEKHFGDADEPSLSQGLVKKVLDEVEGGNDGYLRLYDRLQRLIKEIYGAEAGVNPGWGREDIVGAFKGR